MSYPDFPFMRASDFKHRAQIEVFTLSSDDVSGRVDKTLSSSYVRYFAYPPARGLNQGEQLSETIEPAGLLKRDFERDIIFQWPNQLVSDLKDSSKEVRLKIAGEEFTPIEQVNVGGEYVYFALKIRAVRYEKSA